MLDNFAHFIVRPQLFGVQPNAFAHQEGEVAHALAGLHLETIQQLIAHELEHVVELGIEGLDVPVALDGKPRKVDGGEAEVPALPHLSLGGIVDVVADACAATHVGDFGFGMAFLVELGIEGRILEGEVGEEALGADFTRELEEVVVGIALVVVDSLLHAEDLNGEDGRFGSSSPCALRGRRRCHS